MGKYFFIFIQDPAFRVRKAKALVDEYRQGQAGGTSNINRPGMASSSPWPYQNQLWLRQAGGLGGGWGVVTINSEGSLLWSMVKLRFGFCGPKYEERRACLLACKEAMRWGVQQILVEGDYTNLIAKLKNKCCPNNELGLLINHIRQVIIQF